MAESHTTWMLETEPGYLYEQPVTLTAETHFQFQWNSSRIGFPVASLPVNQENG